MKIRNFHFQTKELTSQELLAYETGVHLGDGSLQIKNRVYRVIYSGDIRNDYDFYSRKIPEIIKKLYKKTPLIYKRKSDNTIILILNSREVVESKVKLGLPVGNKRKLRNIPEWLNKEELIPHFIRGLADADFCLSFKKNRRGINCEPRIEFFTNNKVLAKFVYNALIELKFKVAYENTMNRQYKEYRIRMYGNKMLKKWMKIIGFNNLKHISKLMVFEKFGYCPIRLTTQERMMLLAPSSGGKLYYSLLL